MASKQTYEDKIKAELEKHHRQWWDAQCPDVVKFGKQADKEIETLKHQLKVAVGLL